MARPETQIAIIGAGIIGIATAYYLARTHRLTNLTLIDAGPPMGFTSAQSGENYRNWWPHPAMVALTNRSIDLMQEIARETGNRIAMTRRGYALCTRDRDIDRLVGALRFGFGGAAETALRFHGAPGRGYQPQVSADWQTAPDGVDILQHPDLIRATFPSYDRDIRTVIHIRRGGDISGQQLGQHMLEYLREAGCRRFTGEVKGIAHGSGFTLDIAGQGPLRAERIVNAAGPFAGQVAAMLGAELPLKNSFQQKIAFEDRRGAIPRDLPFSIDLDGQLIDWSDDERVMLAADPRFARFAGAMPGAIHCRPDGGDAGTWVKLGWAFDDTDQPPTRKRQLDDAFPEIVLRGAARLNPALRGYYGRLPRALHHYGGWYTRTGENWPLIGPCGPRGAFVNAAMSGFGTMAACAAGELCAAWVAGAELPDYAPGFSLNRYDDATLMAALRAADKGIL